MEMIIKNKKILFFLFLALTIFSNNIFGLSINIAHAATLEVPYPTINGQTIGPNTSLPAYIKYLFYAGMFLGFFAVFISLIWAGALYLLSPAMPAYQADAKDRAYSAISGLVLLVTVYLIITTINPQLNLLTLSRLPPTPPPPATKPQPGVSFYTQSDCSDTTVQSYQSSIADFGALKNKLQSIGITQNTDDGTSYISILYNTINFQGQCQYLNPNQKCQPAPSWGKSASIYQYNFNPNGDGVYFYRKSFFNNQGGYLKIDNSKINGIYFAKLENLTFSDPNKTSNDNSDGCTVPDSEKDCKKYDKDGTCAKDNSVCPNLSGENISSIKINGDYLVLLTYVGPKDSPTGPWTNCEEFPLLDDINKTGPQQIKWDAIKNANNNILPNYVVIIPIQH